MDSSLCYAFVNSNSSDTNLSVNFSFNAFFSVRRDATDAFVALIQQQKFFDDAYAYSAPDHNGYSWSLLQMFQDFICKTIGQMSRTDSSSEVLWMEFLEVNIAEDDEVLGVFGSKQSDICEHWND